MKTFAIVPVKELDMAKSRLAYCLSKEDRSGLLLAMLGDVLSALEDMPTIVISPQDLKGFLPTRVTFLLQDGERDLNSAVKQANSHAVKKGADATLFLPADLPLVTSEEVDGVLELGKKHSVIITRALDGGTGILYRRPPDVIESSFTNNSFEDHLREARSRDVEVFVHRSLPLSLDIDTKEDLKHFLEHGKGTKTYSYLRQCGF